MYLNNAIHMKTHGHFRNVAHQVIQPVIQPGQDIDWSIHVPANKPNHQIIE